MSLRRIWHMTNANTGTIESAMIGKRTGLELLRALCVLALVFLNFGHQPVFAGPAPGDVLTVAASQSFCGEPIADTSEHAPCHACRIGAGAALPPACDLPLGPLPVALRLTGTPADLVIARHDPRPLGARAPPSA